METRDQWYKPNLLYNIHYRPPKKPEAPKIITETVQFNPSVCTCGEHGCQPQYRMEKRVLWSNKEVCNTKQQSKVNDREKKNEYREVKFEERNAKQDRKIGTVTESEQIRLKGENDYAVKEIGNVEVEVHDDNDDVKEGKRDECVCKNEVGCSDSKDDICIGEEATNTYNIKENNSDGRSDRNNYEDGKSKAEYREKE